MFDVVLQLNRVLQLRTLLLYTRANMAAERVALVSGANKGIGLAIGNATSHTDVPADIL